MMELIGLCAVIVGLLIVGLAVAFDKGWIGLSAERLAKMRAKVDALQDKFDAKALQKGAATTKKTKAERIAEADALLAAGSIKQEAHDRAVAQILAE